MHRKTLEMETKIKKLDFIVFKIVSKISTQHSFGKISQKMRKEKQ